MKVIRYFGVALDSIRANKLRSSLTMLGIIIGVAAVLTTMGIGAGAAASITERIESQGVNLLSVNSGNGGSGSTLTMGDAEALADGSIHPDLVVVVPEYSSSATLTAGATDSQNQVVGTLPDYATVRNLETQSGRFFNVEETERPQPRRRARGHGGRRPFRLCRQTRWTSRCASAASPFKSSACWRRAAVPASADRTARCTCRLAWRRNGCSTLTVIAATTPSPA